MKPELLSQVDQARLSPVDVRSISFRAGYTAEDVQRIRDNSLTFNAADLLELSPEEVTLLSKRLRLMFTRIASQNGLRIKNRDLESFQEGEANAIEHELSHFRALQEVRPEVAAVASINILPVVANGQILVGLNTMTPLPEVPYSFEEKVRVWMAPRIPSPPDYMELKRFIEENTSTISRDEIEGLIKEVEGRKRNEGRDIFLSFLRGKL